MKKLVLLPCLLLSAFLFAQDVVVQSNTDNSWQKLYRGEATKINDLINTRLDVRFDFSKSWMYGKEWLTVKPHFYPTDSLTLDAKGMAINEVALVNGTQKTPLKYEYDSSQLFIHLGKTFKNNENYVIYIDYISRPDELKVKGSAAITDAKGLYFINPKGTEKDKPTEIWTQGETEANSVWMPTIDKPNQKCTEKISMTVPDKFVTLSNGLMVASKKNTDGTRTDTWKLDLPNAPYLFFMGAGEYSVIKDSYKGKEVSYYVEKEYAPVARKIFGNTPEMMQFYSQKLGIDYAWPKYSQIVGRDYVSGAMENTTATLHQESAYQNARELLDGNTWEEVIAHELFHHWFGDLVTTESWSNLTVNESFADFSETLWDEYKYGKDAGDEHNYNAMREYLFSGSNDIPLVRFYYADKEDMFDAVSYQKGGRILNMLRNYVGEDAFFKSLNKYLTDNKFKSGEAQQLRLAFESVTGEDLNWFWNQWYYGVGHPILKIDYSYNDSKGIASVILKQTQKSDAPFILPIAVDVYENGKPERYNVWMRNRTDTFSFNYKTKPDLINVDADKIILCQKTDNKTAENFIAQMKYAPLYVDRREALDFFAKKNMPELAMGLKDKYAGLRIYTMDKIINDSALMNDASILKTVETLANTDPDRKTRAKALEVLANTGNAAYKPLFMKYISDSSYSISGAALQGLSSVDPSLSMQMAKKYMNDAKGKLSESIANAIMENGTEDDFEFIFKRFVNMPVGQEKLNEIDGFCNYLQKVNDTEKIKKGVDEIIKFKNTIPDAYRHFTDPAIKQALAQLAENKKGAVADYIENALN